jgi:predicted RNA-binding Zn-ribbon protein involved in translation (DUF1610 family)
MRYEFKRKPTKCPKCGASTIAKILYGLPVFHEVEEDLNAGRLVLGGCCMCGDDPKWQCTTCNTKLFKTNKILNELN